MGSKRNRRAGVVDLWTKRVRDPDGTTRTVPSSRHGAGMRWRATYVGDQSREHSRSFARKTDAQRWLDEVTASVVTGQYVDPKAGLVRFKDYAERWRKMQVQRPSSRAHIEIMLRLHTYPVLGDRQLTSILPSDIQSWVRGLTLAPATVGVVHGIASTIFKSAIRDRRLAANPCDGTKLPKVQRPQIVPLTTEQVEAVRAELPAELQALVTLAAGTGMRQGECFGLTVDRVRFLERTLTVDRQLITLAGKPPEFGPPKTNASHRTIPLPQIVVDALAAHLAAYPAEPDGLVFMLAGKPITRQTFGHKWRPAAKTAGLPTGTGFHALRHYYASLLIRHGESVKTVQTRLGHASAVETLDTYSQLWPDSDDRTREAIDSVLGSTAYGLRTGKPATS
ncbi:tyrosine-type recombinase/integrase [Mycobacterium sp. Aquia_216]|uniref:tyrosine-type recombinase/integrase n=1 Tax=Mycobacterium sp. Aquia_216 TaxID=2991729 RepID=UPI00227CD9FE|nr:site-specific integrase [Mycobacterium sp. Aquia_216]WAJ43132.1 tyrosine-type recombinase/integrase [Mycobacterium sp. Aquia_216]